jgi:glycosyltransferase involved in cell wall biosynthesis
LPPSVGIAGAPLRVLWLIDSLTIGGAEALAVEFASAVRSDEVQLQVCCLRSIRGNARQGDLERRGVRVTNLDARSLRDLRAFRRLQRVIRHARPRVVHAHLHYASIWGAVAARAAGVPLLATLHVMPDGAPWWTADGVRERLMCRLLDHWSARVIAVSAAVARAYAASGRIREGKLRVVHNGVDCDRILQGAALGRDLRREIGIGPDTPVVTTVSVLRPGKGVEVLLDAVPLVLARVPDVVFLVVGDGPEREALERRAAALQSPGRVLFLGHRNDVPRILGASDLFAFPSHGDAFPTVLLEAMAAGVPIVASDVGGIPEIVEAATGCLVPASDPGALGESVAALLGTPERRRRMGSLARSRARERFSTEAWCRRLRLAYTEALDGSRESRP